MGTRLKATFDLDNIDREPMGDLAGTILQQVLSTPVTPDYRLEYTVEDRYFGFVTRELKQQQGDVPLDSPDVIMWMSDYLYEGLKELNGGA